MIVFFHRTLLLNLKREEIFLLSIVVNYGPKQVLCSVVHSVVCHFNNQLELSRRSKKLKPRDSHSLSRIGTCTCVCYNNNSFCMHYRLKAGLKLQKASDEKEVQKGIYLLEQPTGRRTSN